MANTRKATASTSTTVTIRLPESLAATVEAVSIIRGRSVGSIMRDALEQWLVRNVSVSEVTSELEAASERERARQERRARLAQEGLALLTDEKEHLVS